MSQYSSPDFWRSQGLTAAGRGDLPAAAECLNRYLAQAPHDTATHYSLAVVYLQSGRADYAVQLLDGLIRSQPQNADAHFYRGCVLHQSGRTAEAAGDFHRALQLQPMHPGALQALQGTAPPSPPGGQSPGPAFYAPSQSVGFVTQTASDSDDLMSLVYWGIISVVGVGAAILLVLGIGMVAAAGSSPASWLVLGAGLLLGGAAAGGAVWMTRREIRTL